MHFALDKIGIRLGISQEYTFTRNQSALSIEKLFFNTQEIFCYRLTMAANQERRFFFVFLGGSGRAKSKIRNIIGQRICSNPSIRKFFRYNQST